MTARVRGDKMTVDIYPMPFFPMLIVKDLEASSSFYQNALGFKPIFTMPGPDGSLRWSICAG